MARGGIFREVRPRAGFKTGDVCSRNVWGATVERLEGTYKKEEDNGIFPLVGDTDLAQGQHR